MDKAPQNSINTKVSDPLTDKEELFSDGMASSSVHDTEKNSLDFDPSETKKNNNKANTDEASENVEDEDPDDDDDDDGEDENPDTESDDESSDETDDDDDDDDDDNPPSDFKGEEDENQLVQIKTKNETALKIPFIHQKQIKVKKPLKEIPKGPEKTERSPWQQMMDFFMHGVKGAMIKNGDISTKESIADKFLIGLGFKSFKEDVLLQEQAKKYWAQKSLGLKADNALLNTDHIKNILKKEEQKERKPFLQQLLILRKKIEVLLKQNDSNKPDEKRQNAFKKEQPDAKLKSLEKKEEDVSQKDLTSKEAIRQDLPHLTAKFEEAKIKTKESVFKESEPLKNPQNLTTEQPSKKSKEFSLQQKKTPLEELKRASGKEATNAFIEKQLEKTASDTTVLATKLKKEETTAKTEKEKRNYENAFINQQIQSQAAKAAINKNSQNMINEQLVMLESLRKGLTEHQNNHVRQRHHNAHHQLEEKKSIQKTTSDNQIINTETQAGKQKAVKAFVEGIAAGQEKLEKIEKLTNKQQKSLIPRNQTTQSELENFSNSKMVLINPKYDEQLTVDKKNNPSTSQPKSVTAPNLKKPSSTLRESGEELSKSPSTLEGQPLVEEGSTLPNEMKYRNAIEYGGN